MALAAGLGAVWTNDDVAKFMECALVKWVKTFKKSNEDLDFDELVDSVYLLDVLLAVDGGNDGDLLGSINRSASMDVGDRRGNWLLLVRTLHKYYSEYLQQLVVCSWPDVLAMEDDSDRGTCMSELQKSLVLLLGYAVQCDRKQDHIETIKTLEVETQKDLVLFIQQVTDVPKNVLSLEDDCRLDSTECRQIIGHLCHERLRHIEKLGQLASALDQRLNQRLGDDQTCQEGEGLREQIRSLKEELEEKTRRLAETKETLCDVTTELSKTKSEVAVLASEAKTARIYKDELDAMKEMTIRAEKYRKELEKYKEKLSDIDFYKTRVEELRKDNDLMLESKATMERQLISSNKRIDKILDELVLAQIQLKNCNTERTALNRKLIELAEDNARLEFDNSQLRSGMLASNIHRFMSTTSIDCIPSTDAQQTCGLAISDEVNETLMAQLKRIQMENDDMKITLKEATDKYQDLERDLEHMHREEDEKFQKKLDAIQQQASEEIVRKSRELRDEFEQKVLEIEQSGTKQRQKVSKEFQQRLSDMGSKNQSLQQHIEELQTQIKFTEDAWNSDRDLCARIHDTTRELLPERQLKRGASLMRDCCQNETGALQAKLESVEKGANVLQRQNKTILDLCDDSFDAASSSEARRLTPKNHRQRADPTSEKDNGPSLTNPMPEKSRRPTNPTPEYHHILSNPTQENDSRRGSLSSSMPRRDGRQSLTDPTSDGGNSRSLTSPMPENRHLGESTASENDDRRFTESPTPENYNDFHPVNTAPDVRRPQRSGTLAVDIHCSAETPDIRHQPDSMFPTAEDANASDARGPSLSITRKDRQCDQTRRAVCTILPPAEDTKSRTPVRGIVVPQRRTTDHVPPTEVNPNHSSSRRQSMQTPTSAPPLPDLIRDRLMPISAPFSRNDPYRHSMPSKMSSSGRRRHPVLPLNGPPSTGPGSGHKTVPSGHVRTTFSPRTYVSSAGASSASEQPSFTESCRSSRDYDDDDTTSIRSHLNNSMVSSNDVKGKQSRGGQWSVSYSEKTVTQILESLSIRSGEDEWKALVDQILCLQAQNKQLANQMQATKAVREKLLNLEERNLELEQENRKLKQIVESLHGPMSLYDTRMYQFNTSV